jgi:CubicO group peptidase (beta-lactamase class C family)
LRRVAVLVALLHVGCASRFGGWLPSRGPTAPAAIEARIRRVESGLGGARPNGASPTARMALGDRMAHYRVPGVAIAVIQGGVLEWARGYGRLAAGGDEAVGPDTLFQAASISKTVAAVAALVLIGRGAIGLDDDVGPRLVSWRLPEGAQTRSQRVTLRRLLSHTAGTGVSGFAGYGPGEPVPTLSQILDGTPPSNSKPVRVETVPGSAYAYSGGGYCIVEQLVGDLAGAPFARFTESAVLAPLGMSRSRFAQPLPETLRAGAATGHDAAGRPLPGRARTYPEQAAAGLWTTATDLGRLTLELLAARAGRSRVVPPGVASELWTPVRGDAALGVFVNGRGDAVRLRKGGSNAGFRGVIVGLPETGQGAVVLANGDGADPLLSEILLGIAAEYEWPDAAIALR